MRKILGLDLGTNSIGWSVVKAESNKDGKEVEFGIVDPSWIAVPLDAGTYKVLSDGYKIIIDKRGYFEDLKL